MRLALSVFLVSTLSFASVSVSIVDPNTAQITITDQKDHKTDAVTLNKALLLPTRKVNGVVDQKLFEMPDQSFVISCGGSAFMAGMDTCSLMVKNSAAGKVSKSPLLISYDLTADPNPLSELFLREGDTLFEYESGNKILRIHVTPTEFRLNYN
ncbi:hypothetical protein K2X33_06005 [bacterium]|nr:hypothetical protein [bacterium]